MQQKTNFKTNNNKNFINLRVVYQLTKHDQVELELNDMSNLKQPQAIHVHHQWHSAAVCCFLHRRKKLSSQKFF